MLTNFISSSIFYIYDNLHYGVLHMSKKNEKFGIAPLRWAIVCNATSRERDIIKKAIRKRRETPEGKISIADATTFFLLECADFLDRKK